MTQRSLLDFVDPGETTEDHAGLVAQALACLDRFTDAFNAADLAAMRAAAAAQGRAPARLQDTPQPTAAPAAP